MKKFVIAGLAAAVATALLGAAAWAQSLQLPAGSWRSSCGDARAYYQNGGRYLTARCSNSRGGSEVSTLRFDDCRGDIANRDGRLVCGNPGPLPPPSTQLPDGSYRQSCRGAYVSSGRLYAECRDSRGYWQRTSIDLASCRGRDIANIDGRLTCSNGGGGGGQLPPGSWRSSCDQAYMSGSTLVATCRDSRGNRVRSSLDTRTCNGRDIANIDGRLTCTGGGGGGGGGQIPQGSYRSSCSNAYLQGWILNAQCRDSRGYLNRTSIDIRGCNNRDIANVDGRLTCSSGGGGGGGGFGSLTLCTQPNYGGRCETFRQDAPGLGPWELSDKAQSVRVSGRWQVCTDRDYRGRCMTLDRDERDLSRFGISRQISSLRRIR